MLLDVRRLPPAHRLIAGQGRVRLKRYWDIDPSARTTYRRDEDYAAHFRHLFGVAVADRLRTQADGVGIAMSGGLDSCSIAAVAQRVLSAEGGWRRLIACSYAFDHLSDCDERAYSGAMAAELGIKIEYIEAERFWLLGDPVAFRPDLESPFMAWESCTHHMLGRLRESGAKVVLTGYGGDNLLTGTSLAYVDRLLRGHLGVLREVAQHARERGQPFRRLLYAYIARPLVPEGIIRAIRRLGGRDGQPVVPDWIMPGFARRISLAERLVHPPVARRFPSLARQANYECATALGSVARGVYWYDRTAPRFCLEPRHPFLDRRLAEFVLSVPPEQLFRAGRRKLILRQALGGVLPEVVRSRPDKTKFGKFIDFSLREKEYRQVFSLLERPLLGKMGIVDSKRLRLAYGAYLAGEAQYKGFELWFPITLELWLRRYNGIFTRGIPGGPVL